MSNHMILKKCNSVWRITFLILLLFCSRNDFGCLAQDDFQDDAGADTTGNDATNDMTDTDPNAIYPHRPPGNNPEIINPNSIKDNLTGRSIALLQ